MIEPPPIAPPTPPPTPLHLTVPGMPLARPKRGLRAPNWLQATLIFAIFGAALFVAVNERYLWSALLAVAGVAFGASFVLRRMVGDEYDRS